MVPTPYTGYTSVTTSRYNSMYACTLRGPKLITADSAHGFRRPLKRHFEVPGGSESVSRVQIASINHPPTVSPMFSGRDVFITEARGGGGGRDPPETHCECHTGAAWIPSESRPRAAPGPPRVRVSPAPGASTPGRTQVTPRSSEPPPGASTPGMLYTKAWSLTLVKL